MTCQPDTRVAESLVTEHEVADQRVTESMSTDTEVTDAPVIDIEVTDAPVIDIEVTDAPVTDAKNPAAAGAPGPGAGWLDVGRPVSRRAVVVAHLVPLTVLPSGVWRIVLGFGAPLGFSHAVLEADRMPGWGTVSMVFLTVLTESLALLGLGLVRPWGEVVPARVPRLAARRIPPAAVVAPATIGGLLLTAMWAYALLGVIPVDGVYRLEHFSGTGWLALMIVCYAPALLWGPMLLWLTHQYRLRRRAA